MAIEHPPNGPDSDFEATDAAAAEAELRDNPDTKAGDETARGGILREILDEVEELEHTESKAWGADEHARLVEIQRELADLLKKVRQGR